MLELFHLNISRRMHKGPFMVGASSAKRMRKIKKGEGTSGVNDSG